MGSGPTANTGPTRDYRQRPAKHDRHLLALATNKQRRRQWWRQQQQQHQQQQTTTTM